MNEPIEVAADCTTLTITKTQPKILAWFEAIGQTEEYAHCFDWPEGEEDPRAHVAKQLIEYALRRDKSLQEHPSGALGGTPIVLVQAYLDESPTVYLVETLFGNVADVHQETNIVAATAFYSSYLDAHIKALGALVGGNQDASLSQSLEVAITRSQKSRRSLLLFAAERARLEKIRRAQSEVDVNKNDPPNHRSAPVSAR